MKNWSNTLQSECVEKNNDDLNKLASSFSHNSARFKIKLKKDNVLNEYTDIFGDRKKINHPIFTQNEIAQMSRNKFKDYFFSFLFIVLEGIIFSQIISMMIPREIRKEVWWISFPIGIILSYMLLLAVKKALENHFTYLEAKMIQQERALPEYKLQKFRRKNGFAIILFLFFIAFSVFAGIIRERMILGAAVDTNPFLGKIVFMMSLTLSLLVIFLLAMVNHDLAETKIKYAVFNNWKKHEKERKEYITKLKAMHAKDAVDSILTGNTEKYWQLMLDLNRIYGAELDDSEKNLDLEYKKLFSPPTNTEIAQEKSSVDDKSPKTKYRVNDLIYGRFKSIQSAHEELFVYGIEKHEVIASSAAELKQKIENQYTEIEEFEKTYKLTNNENEPETT